MAKVTFDTNAEISISNAAAAYARRIVEKEQKALTVQPKVIVVSKDQNHTFIEDDIRNSIMVGDAREIGKRLPPKSISAIITSPPYHNKRIYAKKIIIGEEAHAYPEPIIWGGSKDCNHTWVEKTKKVHNGRRDAQKSSKFSGQKPIKDTIYHYRICSNSNCKAYEGELGQEKEYTDYISHLADVFDPLLIALRDDGVCFINLGDSMIDGEQANIPVLFAEEMKKRGWKQRRGIIWYKKNAMSASDPSNFTMDYEHFLFFVKRNNKKKYYFETQFKPYAESTLKDAFIGS